MRAALLAAAMGRRRRAAAFTPASFAGLALWLPTSLATVTIDGSNRMSAHADQSGNAKNATQATAIRQPLYTASDALMGNAAAVTSDATRYMATPSIDLTTAYTYAFAGRITGAGVCGLFRQASTVDTLADGWCMYVNAPNGTLIWGRSSAATWFRQSPASTWPTDTTHVIIVVWDGTDHTGTHCRMWIDGTEIVLATTGLAGAFTLPAANPIWPGAGYSSGALTSLLNGAAAEQVLYNRAITTAERNTLGTYLAAKVGKVWTP